LLEYNFSWKIDKQAGVTYLAVNGNHRHGRKVILNGVAHRISIPKRVTVTNDAPLVFYNIKKKTNKKRRDDLQIRQYYADSAGTEERPNIDFKRRCAVAKTVRQCYRLRVSPRCAIDDVLATILLLLLQLYKCVYRKLKLMKGRYLRFKMVYQR